MRRVLVMAMVVGVLGAATAGCARENPAGPARAAAAPAGDWPAGVKEAEVYAQVLRRYLSTPAESSFPGSSFTTVYVLDQAYPDAADPRAARERGVPIAANTQRLVTEALADDGRVVFVADPETVMERPNGCAQVKGGGILMTLGPVAGDDIEVRVAVNGFVACLGATWLTYVVHNQPGVGWRVTGTTGSMAVA
jgi:hypothetical protein